MGRSLLRHPAVRIPWQFHGEANRPRYEVRYVAEVPFRHELLSAVYKGQARAWQVGKLIIKVNMIDEPACSEKFVLDQCSAKPTRHFGEIKVD